jgi:hypothetical protein
MMMAEVRYCFLVLTGPGAGSRRETWRPPTDLTFMLGISSSLHLLLLYLINGIVHLQSTTAAKF